MIEVELEAPHLLVRTFAEVLSTGDLTCRGLGGGAPTYVHDDAPTLLPNTDPHGLVRLGWDEREVQVPFFFRLNGNIRPSPDVTG